MKAVIVSDIHIGKIKYGKMNSKTGVDTRVEDILRNMDQTIDYAIKNKIQAYFVLGDIYHNKRPVAYFRELFSSRISRILKNKIELFIILGNHDQGKTSSHDLVELREISDHIERLHILDSPEIIEFKDSLLCFLPHVNKVEFNLSDNDYYNFNIKYIRKFNKAALESSKKYKFFFAHFGTNESIAGNSFDLGTIESKKQRIIPLKEFDEKAWTKVYLGDIHKPQEMNDFCRHIGSIAKVDFGEEDEQKGFYHVDGDKDNFELLDDREFKTLKVDLTSDPRKIMGEFCDDVQDAKLSKSIVRLQVRMKEKDKRLINFNALEEYLRDESWKYIGKSIISTKEEEEIILEGDELNYVEIFKEYTKSSKKDMKDRIYDGVMDEGQKILEGVLNNL